MGEHLHDNVGRAENLAAIGDDLCAFSDVVGVGVARFNSSPGFYNHFEPRFRERGHDGGYQRDSALSRKGFTRHTYDHQRPQFLRSNISRHSNRENQNRSTHAVSTGSEPSILSANLRKSMRTSACITLI